MAKLIFLTLHRQSGFPNPLLEGNHVVHIVVCHKDILFQQELLDDYMRQREVWAAVNIQR